MIAQTPLTDLVIPAGMSNAMLERVLLWAEFAAGAHTLFGHRLVDEVVGAHGYDGLSLLGSAIHRSRVEAETPDFEPSAAWAKARAAELIAAGDPVAAVEAMREHRAELARYHGRITLRCQGCGRYRHGTEWRRAAAPPADWLVMDDATCPDCDWDRGEDDEPETAQAKLYAWLAAGEAEPEEGGAA